MKKRITALLLCLVMVFSLIPTSVWATESPATDAGSGGIEERDPNALTKEEVKAILQGSNALVAVKCINPNGGCNVNPVKYGLAASTFTMEKNEENGYTLTVETAPFVAAYSNSGQGRGLPHDLYSAETLTWKLSRENDVWTVKPAVEGVDDTILVTHIPEATYDVLKGMKGGIDTRCVNKTTAYTNYGVIAGLVGESAASAQVVKNADGAYILTISTKNFADAASKHNDRVHDLLTGETANFVLSLKNDAGKYVWTATPVTDADGICEVAHRVKVTFDQNYTNAPATTEAMYKYNTAEVMGGAFPADPSRSGYVFQGWNTKADGTGDAFSNATAVTEDVTVYAQWGQLHPVQLVIYRNGDTSKAYKTVSLDPQLKGTVIDLNDVDIGKYYTGNYEFYGWYDDGLWNIYKANVAAGKDAPAGLTTKTVNGWTNFKCMVYDYENVVYFQTKEAMEAYQADHSKTEGIVKSVKALHGSALPTVDAPEATRAGYTFQYWSREGQSVNVTGQTVNGWTNLYGVWKIVPHNIYAFTRLNSAFAPLTKAEFGGFIKLNATTLKDNLGLNVEYNENGYISIGKFNFDAMPLTEDMYFGDDAELDAVKAQSINLENGVSADTADQIAWTFLYQVDNSDYMTEAGYPTDDENGYQLAGNLNVAAVMFNAGGDNVENMPAVNYTYDDGFYQIHDFYFAGKDFTLPADPTREGYIFKGWEATVIPGEDDADCYADPTTDAGAETQTLYKAGDTYTITDGGVIFTAQWEKKTYTIAASLYLNDSESPVMVDSGAYKWTHRYGGEYGVTIDYTEMLDTLKNKALEADKANKPYDAEITLYFPGSDKVFNTAVTTYGQNTARWQEINGGNIAYIKGVATTSYEVIFKDENGNEIETKIVEYGKTVASVDPDDKYGYNFVGWVDQDGNAFTFDNDGNSVTKITHKTVLTAQWAKKVYTIGPDLRINGGETVKAPGKNYSWSPRYSGEYQDVIDYDKVFKDLTAKVEEVDKDNDPSKIEIKLCFPGKTPANTDEGGLFNEVITYFGQEGAGWNPGVKNTAYIWGYATTYYDVIFDSNGGTAVVTQKNVQYGTTATEPENPTKYGYNFTGWVDEDGNAFDFDTKITHKTVLTAQWAKKDYVIASDLRINGGDANLADGKTYAWTHRYGGKFEETIDYQPMLDALKARAMKVDAANGPVDSVVTLCFPGSDKLFNDAVKTYGQDTANWQAANNTAYIWGYATNVYAVTFNYGTEDIKNEILKVNFGDTITKSEPKRDGYKFTGWYDENGNLFDFATPITKSMTLTAGWEIIPHDIYAYARLNSSFGQLTTSEWGDDIKLNAETLKNLGLEIGYNGNGYISIGKFTFNAMALTDDLYFDDETTAAVLEALKKDIVLETGVSADTAAKIAWTFLYQADDSEDSDYMYKSGYPATDKDSYQLSGNLFLAAAMFDAGDVGEDEVKGMPAVNYTFDDVFAIHDFYLPGTEIELPALERTGYTFLGWEVKVIPSDDVANYADADAEKTLVEAGKYTITEGGAIFTAQWKINTYNVTFDSNGGSAVESQQVDYRAKVTKPAEPTREGYHFMGWFNGDKEWNFDEDTMGAGDMTLTAKWEINEYTVSFDSKGGTKVDSQIVKHGDTADKPSNPRRNGYVFKGWYLDGQKFDFSTPITGDTTLTARWATKTSGGSNSSSDTTTKDNGKTVKSGKTFDGGIALYVGLSVLSATGSALVITKKKRG